MKLEKLFLEHLGFASILIVAILGNPSHTTGAEYTPFEGEKTAWHGGFDRYDFVMDEETLAIKPFKRDQGERFGVKAPPKGRRRCIVVVPKTPAPGNPWSWQAVTGTTSPRPKSSCSAGLPRRVRHARPGQDVGRLVRRSHREARAVEEARVHRHEPGRRQRVRLGLGQSRQGFLHLRGQPRDPSRRLRQARRAGQRRPSFEHLRKSRLLAGTPHPAHRGPISSTGRPDHRDDQGRRGASSPQPAQSQADRRLDREELQPAGDRPDFTDETFTKSSYYSLADSYRKLEEEKTYATCRGPGFTECYDRYDATTRSPWGVTGMAVIVPKTAAPGKPWVFRADRIGREAGRSTWPCWPGDFTSSRPPLVAQSGPVREQWDAVYKLLPTTAFPGSP